MTAAFRTYGAFLRDLDAIIPLSLPALREGIAPTDKGTKPYLLKQLAMISSDCEECLFLDADNVPVRDPTFLFDTPAYREGGMLLWPDLWHNHRGPAPIRAIFDLPSGGDAPLADERTVESGQIVFHKARVWQALLLSTYMQIQTDFFDNLVGLWGEGGWGEKRQCRD
jgi:alpha 1,2-mannosyltransferase